MLPSEHPIGECAVDRRNRPSPIFEHFLATCAVLKPRSNVGPVPERTSYIASDRMRKMSLTTLTANKHGYRLAAASRSLGDVCHGDKLIIHRKGLERAATKMAKSRPSSASCTVRRSAKISPALGATGRSGSPVIFARVETPGESSKPEAAYGLRQSHPPLPHAPARMMPLLVRPASDPAPPKTMVSFDGGSKHSPEGP